MPPRPDRPRRRLARGVPLLLALLAPLTIRAAASADTFETRRDLFLADQAREPFPSPVCRQTPAVANPTPADVRRQRTAPWLCIQGQVAHALVLFERGDPAGFARANGMIESAVALLPRAPGWKRVADPMDPDSTERTGSGSGFSFLTAQLLHRVVSRHGSVGPSAPRRLDGGTEERVRDLFWSWAETECRLADAAPALIWRPYGSENKDIMQVEACWGAAELVAATRPGDNRRHADGSTPAQQRAAWTEFLKTYIRVRAANGGLVEIFSPAYGKYVLSVFHNAHDLASDPELRTLAGNFITLWWARWAEEQLGGVHAGPKARFAPREMMRVYPGWGITWVYFGFGDRTRVTNPANLPILLTDYRAPEIVREIVASGPARGGQEVWSRQLGLSAGPMRDERYSLSPDTAAITRYTFVTPDAAMGTMLTPRLHRDRWIGPAMHNRWSGLVLADAPDARIYAIPDPVGRPSTFNGTVATGHRLTQIIQRIPPPLSGSTGRMRIWVGPRLPRAERDGWIFVQGRAWVAVRPAFGGHVPDPSNGTYLLRDDRSPVILQAGPRDRYPTFEAFQSAVLAARLRVEPDLVEFDGLDGAGRLRFFLEGERVAERDGRPIEAPAEWSLQGPHVRQRRGESTVEIAQGSRRLTLRFDAAAL